MGITPFVDFTEAASAERRGNLISVETSACREGHRGLLIELEWRLL
jgi:hypothetical protein